MLRKKINSNMTEQEELQVKLNEFAGKVCAAVQDELGAGYRIELKEVKKNNGVLMRGLMVFSDSVNIVPTIYLESFWDAYEDGISFAAVVRRIVKLYREEVPEKDIDMDFFRYFDRVKDRICYRLVRRGGNEELLKECPHVEFLDLAICFFYAYDGARIGEGSILIKNAHALRWGVKTGDLMRCAETNTARLFRWESFSMEELLCEREGSEPDGGTDQRAEPGKSDGAIPMRVLTNEKRIHGAVSMIYRGVLEKLAEEAEKSFYILPSSIHEVILLADTGREEADGLKRMIREVNASHVAPEEVLSDNLYYYDFREKRVKIID